MRTRALLLPLLVGALSVAATVTVASATVGPGRAPSGAGQAARTDVADAPGQHAVARVQDPFASERDGRRVDAVVLLSALLLATGLGWWMVRSRRARRATIAARLGANPRAPPVTPALVCT